VAVRDRLETLFQRELLRALAGQHHVRRFLHDQPREPDRAAHVAQAGDRAGPQVAAIHQ
jgi:hypothetical protein